MVMQVGGGEVLWSRSGGRMYEDVFPGLGRKRGESRLQESVMQCQGSTVRGMAAIVVAKKLCKL